MNLQNYFDYLYLACPELIPLQRELNFTKDQISTLLQEYTPSAEYQKRIADRFWSCKINNNIINDVSKIINQREYNSLSWNNPCNFANYLSNSVIPELLEKDLCDTISNHINNGYHLDLFASDGQYCTLWLGIPKLIIWANLYLPIEEHSYQINNTNILVSVIPMESAIFTSCIPSWSIDSISINGVDLTIIPPGNDYYLMLLNQQIQNILKPWWILIMMYNDYYKQLWKWLNSLFYDENIIWWFTIYQKPLE